MDGSKKKLPLRSRFGKYAEREFFSVFNTKHPTHVAMWMTAAYAVCLYGVPDVLVTKADTIRGANGAAQVAQYTREISQWNKNYTAFEQRSPSLSPQACAQQEQVFYRQSANITMRIAYDMQISERDVRQLAHAFSAPFDEKKNSETYDERAQRYAVAVHPRVEALTKAAPFLRENREQYGTSTTQFISAAETDFNHQAYLFFGTVFSIFGATGYGLYRGNKRHKKIVHDDEQEARSKALQDLRKAITPKR